MIRVDVLGGLRVSDASRVYQELSHQPMRAALLVMLAVDRTSTRDRVLSTLWPDRNAERGRRALNQTVYELRRTLGERCIVAAGETLSAGENVQSDVHAFEQALANGDIAAAVEHYRGPFLSGFFLAPTNEFEDWSTRHHARLARAARKARLLRVEELLAAGRQAQALGLAQRAVAEDPLEDEYQHTLIQLLVRVGERAAALRQFESYRQRLKEQGLKPLDHTCDLIAGIREPEPAAPAAPTAPAVPGTRTAAVPASATRREPPAGPVPEPPASAAEGAAGDRPREGRPRRRHAVAAAMAGVAVVVLAVVAVLGLPLGEPPAPADSRPQLTVVLFSDASREPNYGYLARGISETLVHSLQQRVPGLRVIALEDSPTPTAAAKSPGSDHSTRLRLDGTLAVDSGSVRVRVRLSDLDTGELLRPIEVRHPWTSELALIDSVVPAIIEQMQPELGQQIRRRELRAGTSSAEAFALYLRASEATDALRRIALVGDQVGAERMLASIDSLLERADRADPAWSRIATLRARVAQRRALIVAFHQEGPASPRAHAHFAAALRYADEAVARDPHDADALTGRAKVRFAVAHLSVDQHAVEQRRALAEGAEQDVHQAVAADPLRSEAWLLLANLHSADGDWQKAHAAAFQAYQTDAFLRHRREALAQLAISAFHLGRDPEAERWCYQGAAQFPESNLWWECRSHLFAYREPPAVDSALALVEVAGTRPRTEGIQLVVELNAAYALAAAGQTQRARARLAETRRLGTGGNDARYLEATVHAALGDTATAIRLIRAYARDFPDDLAMLAGRPLRGLRDHPGFPRPIAETR